MNKLVALALSSALLALPGLATAQTNSFGPLLSAAEVNELRASVDPLILDIRAGEENGKTIYELGHIPDAVHAPYGLFRGPAENPGAVPSDEKLTEVLRTLGVTYDRPTLIVHQGKDETDFGAAARVYWTLKSSGVSQIAILNGGMNAWTEGKFEVSTAPAAELPSDITVTLSDRWMADADHVLSVVEGKHKARLIDSRPQSFWEGKQSHAAAARPGTLPQSEYFTHSRWFTSGPTTLDADAVRRLASENGYGANEELVSFCNTGHWAATNWFALSELAGIEDVKLYPESMVGWSQADLPMENVPGVLSNLWHQIKSVF